MLLLCAEIKTVVVGDTDAGKTSLSERRRSRVHTATFPYSLFAKIPPQCFRAPSRASRVLFGSACGLWDLRRVLHALVLNPPTREFFFWCVDAKLALLLLSREIYPADSPQVLLRRRAAHGALSPVET